MNLHDQICVEITAANINMLVPWWIIAAYCYDVEDSPIISDSKFDSLVRKLDENWDTIEHEHKHLLDRSLLKSSIAIQGKYPAKAIGAAKRLINILQPARKKRTKR